MGLQGMINDMVSRCDEDLSQHAPRELKALKLGSRPDEVVRAHRALARLITALENGPPAASARASSSQRCASSCARARSPGRSPLWGSPAPAAPASPRSPTS